MGAHSAPPGMCVRLMGEVDRSVIVAYGGGVDAMGEQGVREANARFYEAFESRELRMMAAAWEQSDRSYCVHPGWPALFGWAAVLPSWYRLFTNTERLQFVISEEGMAVEGSVAWIFCVEDILDGGPEGGVSAINHFARQPSGEWLMVGHVGTGRPTLGLG